MLRAVVTRRMPPVRLASGDAIESIASAQEILGTEGALLALASGRVHWLLVGARSAKVLSISSMDSMQKCVDVLRENNVGALVVTESTRPKEIAGVDNDMTPPRA